MIRRSHALVQLNTQGKEGDGGGRGLILDKRQDGHWAGEMKGGGIMIDRISRIFLG